MKTKIILKVAALLLIANCMLPTISYSQLIAGGDGFSLAVCSDGTVRAWGGNTYGQLGNGSNTNSSSPVQVSGLTGITAVAAGGQDGVGLHSLALKNDGTIWAWGNNDYGQLGNATNTSSNTPVQVSGLTGITAIACGATWAYSLALKSDGTVWTWGDNQFGELGNGTNNNSNIPVQVSGLTGIVTIAGGSAHGLAVKNNGTVWAWGYNLNGQLGNGTYADSNIPVQVNLLTGVTALAGGATHSLALKTDGTVWAWGVNNEGELGNGTYITSTTPVQVSGLSGITAITADNLSSIALKNDGTVWCWGANNGGLFGNGNGSSQLANTPVQGASGLNGIVSIDAGSFHLLALKNNGTVWFAGNSGNSVSSLSMTQVNSLCYVGTTAPCNLTVSAGSDESTFFGYSGDQQVTRTAVVSGGTAPYTYSWTIGRALACNSVTSAGDEIFSGGTCSNTVCPTSGTLTANATCTGSATVTVRMMDTTEVCVTVTDANNCTATDCFTVNAVDARCFSGNSQNEKVNVCHHTSSNTNPWVQICIADNAVSAHLANNSGDYVGLCNARIDFNDGESSFDIHIYPNPASHTISFNTNGYIGTMKLQVVNMLGQKIISEEVPLNGEDKHTIDVSNLTPGIYKLILLNDSELNTGSFVKE